LRQVFACYLERKLQEIRLMNDCLAAPLDLRPPKSVTEAIEQKFVLAAALKAEHALHDWALTETGWSGAEHAGSGPFAFKYGYQRADLDIRGPAIYAFDAARREVFQRTVYTSSGMSAISALVMALKNLGGPADVLMPAGGYAETLELIASHGAPLRLVRLDERPSSASQILWLDSSASRWQLPNAPPAACDLVVFDTTCFWRGSGRIRRAIAWALRSGLAVALVRSHTKLDSLGVEYGRAGSVVFVASAAASPESKARLAALIQCFEDTLRLFGGAAIPAHLPPFVGSATYDSLSARRIATIERNCRRLVRALAARLDARALTTFAHGLYITLAPGGSLERGVAAELAADCARDLRRAGLPVRHAGSFGFDFVAVEWFRDTIKENNVIRLAVPDLPAAMMAQLADGIARWWRKTQPSRASRVRRRTEEPRHGATVYNAGPVRRDDHGPSGKSRLVLDRRRAGNILSGA
jgi:hypothetical protein